MRPAGGFGLCDSCRLPLGVDDALRVRHRGCPAPRYQPRLQVLAQVAALRAASAGDPDSPGIEVHADGIDKCEEPGDD